MLRVAHPHLRLFPSPQRYSRGCTTRAFGLPTQRGISTNGTASGLSFPLDVSLEDTAASPAPVSLVASIIQRPRK